MDKDELNAPDEGQNEPAPGSKEYNEKMVARFEQGTGIPEERDDGGNKEEVSQMPEGGFEKFFDAKSGQYDWQSHAKELQYKLDQKVGDKSDKDSEEEVSKDADGNKEAVANIVESAGLQMDNLRQQIMDNKKLDDASVNALVKAGIPKELLSEYVDSVVFRLEANTQKAMSYAGGDDGWNSIHDWAATNLNDAEKQRYNAMLSSTNESDWRVAIDTLKTKMAASVPGGREGKLFAADRSGGGAIQGYRSRAEQIADMQDPRYRTDAAFRRKVASKIGVSRYEDDNNPN